MIYFRGNNIQLKKLEDSKDRRIYNVHISLTYEECDNLRNYVSSRKTVELINDWPQRINSYFAVTTLTESDSRTRNKRNPFFLLLYLCSIFFSPPARRAHNQHTNSLSGALPSFLHPPRHAPRYIRQKRRGSR